MKQKAIAIFTALMILTLSACGKTDPPQVSSSSWPGATPVASIDPKTSSTIAPPITAGVFDSAAFGGKIRSCAYAGDHKVMVLADQLSLYDTQTGEVIATATIDLRDVRIHPFLDGYLVVGYGENGISSVLFDGLLANETHLPLGEILGEDFLPSTDGVSISPDGNTVALAGLSGIYLYDRESMELSTLLSYEGNTQANSMRISTIGSLSFVHRGQKLAYIGQGLPVPAQDGENSFPVYGVVSINGDNLNIIKNSSYTVEELLIGGDQIIMPQSFMHNNGTLLTIDGMTEEETIVQFSTPSEGGDGVFASAEGEYVATAVLADDLTVRIYNLSTGELLHTEVITHADSTYFNRIPRLLILDDSKTCIVLLGCGIDEVDTWSTTIHFEET